jgi:hypothetical protein
MDWSSSDENTALKRISAWGFADTDCRFDGSLTSSNSAVETASSLQANQAGGNPIRIDVQFLCVAPDPAHRRACILDQRLKGGIARSYFTEINL